MINQLFLLKGGSHHICTDTEFDGKKLWIYFKGGFAEVDDCFFME